MAFLAPIVAGIAGALAGGGIGAIALRLGASLLLSAAARALTPKPGDSGALAAQDRLVTVRQAVAPREMVYGRSRKGGVIVFLHSSPQPGQAGGNGRLNIIVVFASHRVRKIGNIYLDGELCVPDGAEYGDGRFAPFYVQCERANGDPDQFAFPGLRGELPGLWTINHRLRGIAAIRLALVWDVNVFPNGLPNITADIEGKDDILDPRTGSRAYSENPPLCLADYMADPVFGIGAGIGAADGIDVDSMFAAANVCDEVVAAPGGGSEPRYACNGVLDLSVTPKANIEGLLTAMAGTCGWQAGQWHLYAGAYRPPVLTLTADDVIDGGIRMTTRISRAELFNGARGTFISPLNDWQPDDFPSFASSVYLAEDRGERSWKDMALPYTIVPGCAQRLAKIEVERVRRQITVELSGKMRAWQATVGDTVALTYPRFGFAAKPFDVVQVTTELQEADGGVRLVPRLVLRETSPAVYDWLASEAQVYAAAPRTTLPTPWLVGAPGGLSFAERLVQVRPGSPVVPVVRISWGASDSAFVSQYQVEERQGGGDWHVLARTDATFYDREGVTPGRWQYRVKAVSILGVSSAYSTGEVSLGGLAVPPVALTRVTAQIANGLVLLSWDQSADIDVRTGGWIEIRHSTSAVPLISDTYQIALAPGVATQFLVPQLPGTYFVRAVDSTGAIGPAVAVDVVGETALAFAPVQVLQADPGFTGPKVRTELIGGFLKISPLGIVSEWSPVSGVARVGDSGGVSPEGRYDFATGMNLGSLRRVRLRSVIRMKVENPTDRIGQRFGPVSSWRSVSGGAGGEVDVVVEVRTTQTNPTGSPVWSAWSRLDSNEVRAWGVQARAFLRTRDASFTPAVDVLRVIAEEVT